MGKQVGRGWCVEEDIFEGLKERREPLHDLC